MPPVISLALRNFWRSAPSRLGSTMTLGLLILALVAPLLRPYNPAVEQGYLNRLQSPSLEHPLGTDGLGRDVLTAIWHGIGTSLGVSLTAVSLGLLIGLLLGLVAGYFRGMLELTIGWLTDILLAFPSILLAIAIVTVTGPSLQSVILAVGIIQIPIYIRLTRSMVLSLREQEFIQAVQAIGASPPYILQQHILPAVLAPLIVQATLSISMATLEAAGLGFLGLGIRPPTPELGTMLADAFKGGYALSAPWTTLFPGLMITLMVVAFNLLGDGLRDSLNPGPLIKPARNASAP
ncbi:ABC transporter permease [Leptolyngbya sp. 'hensonii']|uniref:ABC transporter permease n=1 Tax=Leptolyngbya sp. 'hensonii' TaxID=1922337 RepID=UPI0009FA2087|nr:ABC transporter permease [Leptolyngbya sp. 'hensonii']